MEKKTSTRFVLPLMAATMVAGLGSGIAAFASAQTVPAASTTSTAVVAGTDTNTSTGTAPAAAFDPHVGGHVGKNGVKETLLTGDAATKVTAAALAAVPGGTVMRVENDAEGATYEAHMTKADGTRVTVKLDGSYAVTGIETGGPGGPHTAGA